METENDTLPSPSLGRMLQYLRGLGFTIARWQDGIVDCREPGSDRPEDGSIPKHEVYLARTQLGIRGLATEHEFDDALSAELQSAT